MKPRIRRKAKRTATSKSARQHGRFSRDVKELWGEADGDELSELLESKPSTRAHRQHPKSSPKATERSFSSGRVVAISSGACTVDDGSDLLTCQLPSRLATHQQASIAIGDQVQFVPTEHGWRVSKVLPRSTFLARPDPRNHRLQRVIAANIDLVVHVASVVEPALRVQLIDRFLVAISRGGATPLICVNKIELLTEPTELAKLESRLDAYRDFGTDVVLCSAKLGTGMATLRSKLEHRCSVFVGHSGVGKSSLLNALLSDDPSYSETEVATGAVATRSGKGQHTTTRSSFHRLGDGIEIIDTPGIREFGLWRIDPNDLDNAFPDLKELAKRCRFSDCSHRTEPDCAIHDAIASGRLQSHRLAAFHRLNAEIAGNHE